MKSRAAELREQLAEAPEVLRGFAQSYVSANGNGPDPGELREWIESAGEIVGLCNELQEIEQVFDRGRHEIRSAAEQLLDGLREGDVERIRAVALAQFEAFSRESTAASPRETQIALINEVYRFPEHVHVVDVIEHGEGEDATYDLVMSDNQRIRLGGDKAVMDPRLWERRVIPRTKHEPPYMVPKDFNPIGRATLRAARRDEASSTEEEQTREWLAAFRETPMKTGEDMLLYDAAPLDVDLADSDRLYHLLLVDQPIFGGTDGRLYVRVGAFLKFVRVRLKEPVTDAQIRARLGRLGFRKPRNAEGKLSVRNPDGEDVASRRFLASPSNFRLET